EVHSISAGLDYPGVGPEHSLLKDIARVKYVSVTDNEALDATKLITQQEGILPALETAHAIAYLNYLMPQTSKDEIVIVNISGRGDKDLNTIIDNLGKAI
ncbi:MAG: tryptophan synthase subunit beta, partial [Ignavibacteria bacterium]|nr:tryptophan synthase subunit beta [Ignavibacteria bacterium]